MDFLYSIIIFIGEPFGSGLYALGLLSILLAISKKSQKPALRAAIIAGFTAAFWIVYKSASLNENVGEWLERLNSPIVLAAVVLVIPAVFLPRGRWRKFFMILPAVSIALLVFEVFGRYSQSPEDAGFVWFVARPLFVIAAFTGLLVICRHFLPLSSFRKLTRITMLFLLIYGGFAFRQSYIDYKDMTVRRGDTNPDMMLIAETVPVLRSDDQVTHVPSAPCRFSADGGYVQGCPMELLQRTAQVNYPLAVKGNVSESSILAIGLGALVFVAILAFIGARWWCGWICPLSTLGDVFDTVRRRLGLPHFKASQPVKLTYLISGLSIGTFGLLLAKAYPHIDANGRFMGCKIPVYPFCKICPGQQVCPVASKGPGGYPGLPTWDWLYGFFLIGCLSLLTLFLASFALGRRLWCHLCPMGMIGGIFNRGGFFALKKDVIKCNKCGVCNEVCPMDIQLVAEEMEKEDVSSFECIYCMKCVDNCPQDKCLRVEFAGHKVCESAFLSAGSTFR
jgi:ferredoxin-type protein NapH